MCKYIKGDYINYNNLFTINQIGQKGYNLKLHNGFFNVRAVKICEYLNANKDKKHIHTYTCLN